MDGLARYKYLNVRHGVAFVGLQLHAARQVWQWRREQTDPDLHVLDLLPEQQQRRERARVGRLHVRLQRLVGQDDDRVEVLELEPRKVALEHRVAFLVAKLEILELT